MSLITLEYQKQKSLKIFLGRFLGTLWLCAAHETSCPSRCCSIAYSGFTHGIHSHRESLKLPLCSFYTASSFMFSPPGLQDNLNEAIVLIMSGCWEYVCMRFHCITNGYKNTDGSGASQAAIMLRSVCMAAGSIAGHKSFWQPRPGDRRKRCPYKNCCMMQNLQNIPS